MLRKIIKINEEKCNGCGACAQACHEGAIAMVDGKAKLMREDYCDGLGDCLPACPTNAITFEEREALAYDEAAVKAAQEQALMQDSQSHTNPRSPQHSLDLQNLHSTQISRDPLPCGCPGSQAKAIRRDTFSTTSKASGSCSGNSCSAPRNADSCSGTHIAGSYPAEKITSQLSQWPVQIKLAPVNAEYFNGANLLIAADCTAYAYGNFHNEFIRNRITLIGCPKLDEGDYTNKLTQIISENDIKSVTIVRMEVPCCGGIENAAKNALQASGKFIPWNVVTISTDGRIVDR